MLTVFSKIYHQPDASDMTSTRKQIEVVQRAQECGLVPPHWIPSPLATEEDVAKVHDPEFVHAVKTGEPRFLAESQGFRWSPKYGESLFTIFGGHMSACRLAVKFKGLVFHPCSGAHHAGYHRGAAFCTFNFLAGGPFPLLEDGTIKRVLIIDFDEHQGNGTHEIVGADPRFAQFDISGCFFGAPEVDEPETFFKVVRDQEAYFDAMVKLPRMLDLFQPDLVEYQAGMDCFEGDGGPSGMSEEALRIRDRYVFNEVFVKRGIPCVWNLAGGYCEKTVQLHVNTVEEAAAAEKRNQNILRKVG